MLSGSLKIFDNWPNHLEEMYNAPQPMNLTHEEMEDFKASNTCHVCAKQFFEKDKKVRDYCHITGR